MERSDGKYKDAEVKERPNLPYIYENSSTTSSEEAYIPFKSTRHHTTLPTLLSRENPEILEKSVPVTESVTFVSTPASENIDHPETSVTERPQFPEKSVTDLLNVPPSNERIDVEGVSPDLTNQEPKFLERNLFSELFETQTNPSFLQELDKNSAVTRKQNNIDDNLQVDDITLTSLTTQLDKKLPPGLSVEIATSLPISEESLLSLPVTEEPLLTSLPVSEEPLVTSLPVSDESLAINDELRTRQHFFFKMIINICTSN